jgi:hypothetical protein
MALEEICVVYIYIQAYIDFELKLLAISSSIKYNC